MKPWLYLNLSFRDPWMIFCLFTISCNELMALYTTTVKPCYEEVLLIKYILKFWISFYILCFFVMLSSYNNAPAIKRQVGQSQQSWYNASWQYSCMLQFLLQVIMEEGEVADITGFKANPLCTDNISSSAEQPLGRHTHGWDAKIFPGCLSQ